ncbi:MAG: gliding motility-associated C-terminal domain-containing protein [Chitinophagales bacterium]
MKPVNIRVLVVWMVCLFSLQMVIFADGEEGSCQGSLGDNIFTNGDFGSGVVNLVTTNPQIAPGYNYTTNVPPGDGFYTITNNTGAWGNLYPSWLAIRDNSADPNGYMMVVNADFSPGLFYEQEVTGLCPNTQYEFSADIINMIRIGTSGHSDPNVEFLLNSNVILSTGYILKSNQWNTYSFSFCTGENETSLTLSIINSAPGGIGNDLALDNISFRTCGPLATIVDDDKTSYICMGADTQDFTLQSTVEDATYTYFQWQVKPINGSDWQDIAGATGPTYNITNFSSGELLYRYIIANSAENLQNAKCRLNSTIKQVVALPIEFEVTTTICEGNELEVGNNVYTSTGVYVDSLVSSIGCDSILTTNLTVLPNPNIDADIETLSPKCIGESNALIEVIEVFRGTPPYTYWLNNTELNTTGIFRNLMAGNHELQIIDKYGCDFVTQILIEEPESLVVETIDPVKIAIGESLTLNTTVTQTDVDFQWTPANGLDCTTCANPTATSFETTTYSVTVRNGEGCVASDSVRIEVDKNFRLAISTAFSPNEDGVNDYFEISTPFGNAIQTLQQMKIFNRWGQVIHEQSEPAKLPLLVKWDGRNDFRLVDTGVYVYLLQFELIDGSSQMFSGTVTVLY